MLNLNTFPNAGIFRTLSNSRIVNQKLNQSLERLETGLKVNRASDNPVAFVKALEIDADIRERQGQVERNDETLSQLSRVDEAQTSILEDLQRIREIADSYDAADDTTKTALEAEADALAASIDEVAATTLFNGTAVLADNGPTNETITYGVEAGQDITHRFGELSISTASGTAGEGLDLLDKLGNNYASLSAALQDDASALSTRTETAIGEVAAESAELGVTINRVLEEHTTRLETDITNLAALRESLIGVSEAEEAAAITDLQIRQQALIASVTVQNAFAASTLDLFV